MNRIRTRFGRRLRIGLAAIAACALVLGASGWTWEGIDEGYVKDGDLRLGEWTQTDLAVLVVLYRTNGGRDYNYPTTELLLGVWRMNLEKGYNAYDAARETLRFMRGYCGGGYIGDRCRDATADDESEDFLEDTIVPVVWKPGECMAVQIRSGENWTTRPSTDRHCTPD